MTEEEATTTGKTSDVPKTVEVVANSAFLVWKYPPYCELCNTYFSGEKPSKTHFDGVSHRNRLYTWKKYQNPQSLPKDHKDVLCDICWKDMNTQAIFDNHRVSPAHLKEEKGRLIVQRLKEEYRQLREAEKKE